MDCSYTEQHFKKLWLLCQTPLTLELDSVMRWNNEFFSNSAFPFSLKYQLKVQPCIIGSPPCCTLNEADSDGYTYFMKMCLANDPRVYDILSSGQPVLLETDRISLLPQLIAEERLSILRYFDATWEMLKICCIYDKPVVLDMLTEGCAIDEAIFLFCCRLRRKDCAQVLLGKGFQPTCSIVDYCLRTGFYCVLGGQSVGNFVTCSSPDLFAREYFTKGGIILSFPQVVFEFFNCETSQILVNGVRVKNLDSKYITTASGDYEVEIAVGNTIARYENLIKSGCLIWKGRRFSYNQIDFTERPPAQNTPNFPFAIGHRGSGVDPSAGNFAENTIRSFQNISSVSCAPAIEFDVQLTSDFVPIIYHDWVVSELGHQLDRVSVEGIRKLRTKKAANGDLPYDELWEAVMHDPIPTLEEALNLVPLDCCFNIEIKYPTTREIDSDRLLPPAHSINTICNNVLDVVYQFKKHRNVVFSSFHPEIVIALKMKQAGIPVFFLSDCLGEESSLKGGLSFIKQFQLDGLVCNENLFRQSTKWMELFCSEKIQVWSYGGGNATSKKGVESQLDAGVSCLITDDLKFTEQLAVKK